MSAVQLTVVNPREENPISPWWAIGAMAALTGIGLGAYLLSRARSAERGAPSFPPPASGVGFAPGTGTPPDEVSRGPGPWLGELNAYLQQNGVYHFTAEELTWLYRPTNPPPPAHYGLPRYSEPDRRLWPNIITPGLLGEMLRSDMGNIPLYSSTAWRPRSLNQSVYFGAPNSRHIWFAAIDFNLPAEYRDAQTLRKFALSGARIYRDFGQRLGLGVGIYGITTPSRIHIDAGGGPNRPATWADTDHWLEQLAVA